MVKLAVFKKNVNIIMQVTTLCQFKSWKHCFQIKMRASAV